MFWTMFSPKKQTPHEIACEILREAGWQLNTCRLQDLFKEADLDVLGCGGYGVVIDNGNCVVKYILAADDGYRAFLDLCIAHESDYLPEIFWTEMVTDDIMAVAMEFLDDLNHDVDENGYETVKHAEYNTLNGLIKQYSKAYAEANPELIELVNLLSAQRRGLENTCNEVYLSNDLHSGNVMLRGEHLVLIDPWC